MPGGEPSEEGRGDLTGGPGSPPELRYEVGDRVARITIDRPHRRNALSWPLVVELRKALARAREDASVAVVVLSGAGEEAFSAGADLGGAIGDRPGFLATHDSRGELAGLFGDLWSLGKPTIARVRGWALAAGFGLALACDLVVAADDARFGTPEVDVGLWPFVITVPLLRSMPAKVALELMMTGRRVGAEEGARIGFVNRVVPAADLDQAVDELAATLSAKPAGALRLGRDSFYAVLGRGDRESLAHLQSLLTVVSQTEDAAEGIAAFMERRPPRWVGR
ncbi:MAG: enoyl-CoA hydratase/isomerase family protein [Acidimicrobiales bacterium]